MLSLVLAKIKFLQMIRVGFVRRRLRSDQIDDCILGKGHVRAMVMKREYDPFHVTEKGVVAERLVGQRTGAVPKGLPIHLVGRIV